MGMTTFLSGLRIGTKKNGATANCGAVVAAQTAAISFSADGTVNALFNLPAGAQIVDVNVDTTTVFNAATTNTIKLGTTSGGAELLTDTGIGPLGRAALTTTPVLSAWMVGTSDITVYATYNQTGVVASTGAGRVTVLYTVKNSDATIANPA